MATLEASEVSLKDHMQQPVIRSLLVMAARDFRGRGEESGSSE
jgi:hypothetical protein